MSSIGGWFKIGIKNPVEVAERGAVINARRVTHRAVERRLAGRGMCLFQAIIMQGGVIC